MFFVLSKVLWFLLNPGNVLLVSLCVSVALLWTRWSRVGKWLATFTAVVALAMAILPLGRMLYLPLENRFPVVHAPPEPIAGIIALGGILDQFVTRARGQPALGDGAERLTEFARLAKMYPEAKLVFTGGSGNVFDQETKEADYLGPVLEVLGLDAHRVVIENRSRNTYENALYTRNLIKPAAGEKWVLITSAFHMPRAVGVFRKAGWTVIPYPVDFSLRGDESFSLSLNLVSGMGSLGSALHEWLGLAFYRLTDRTDTFFPAP